MNKGIKKEIREAKIIFKSIKKLYPKIHTFPLKFKNLGDSSGYISTTRIKGTKIIFIDEMVINNSGYTTYPPAYAVCHEWAHVILARTKGSLRHTNAHANLTEKLADRFNA